MRLGGRADLRRPPQQEHEAREARKQQAEQEEYVGKGHHRALLAYEQEKLLQRHVLRVRTRHARGKAGERFENGAARPGDGIV